MAGLEYFLHTYVEQYKLLAIFLTMTLESSCIPVPSEVVMPYAGYLVAKGSLSMLAATMTGSLANLTGSWIAYAIGRYKGLPFIDKYGKYVLVSNKHLAQANRWFADRGEITVFLSRMLPGIRTFISLPAGIAKMNFTRFSVYSFMGSLPWNFALIYLGYVFTGRQAELQSYLHRFNLVVFGGLAVLVIMYVLYRRARKNKQ